MWPPKEDAYTTDQGKVPAFAFPKSIEAQVIANDGSSKAVVANAMTDLHVNETLFSEYLAEDLGIHVKT